MEKMTWWDFDPVDFSKVEQIEVWGSDSERLYIQEQLMAETLGWA